MRQKIGGQSGICVILRRYLIMARAGNLQPMPPFDPKTDVSTGAQRWEQWLKRFQRYLLAMDIKSKARQRAMLLYAAGPEVEAIFDTLPDSGDDDDFKTACEKLTEYFSPSKNVPFEVYKFGQAKQQEHETLDAYYTRLCTLAKTCEFADTDTELKQQIIEGCLSNRLRREILMEKSFTLSQILDYGRALAGTDQQTKEIIKQDISDGTEEYTNQLQQDHRRPRTTSKYSSSASKRCFKCGLGFPHMDNQKCPAVDKECYKCHKRGHFDVSNYRPISLLSLVSKVFERFVYNQLISHISTQLHQLHVFSEASPPPHSYCMSSRISTKRWRIEAKLSLSTLTLLKRSTRLVTISC